MGSIGGNSEKADSETATGGSNVPSGGASLDGGPPPVTFECDTTQHDPGPSPLKRLTPSQYRRTIAVVFGSDIELDQVFPDSDSPSYIGLVQADVSQFDVETYQAAAETVAAAVASKYADHAPCAAPGALSTAETCLRDFLSTTGTRIYRSPLSESDITRLLTVFETGYGSGDYAHGLELVLQAMLGAPRFLYRPELGEPNAAGAEPGAVPLSSYELATRLSFAFWNSGPDQELLNQAAGAELETDAGRGAALVRLTADARADESFRQFFYAWFGLGDLDYVTKDTAVYPEWNDETAAQMRTQSDAFFDSILFGDGGTLGALFTAPLAGFAPPALGSWYEGRPEADAAGILTLPALLSVHSKPRESFPIYRGVFVREQLLCQPLPPPPPNVPMPPTPEPGVSTRERFTQHSVDPACSGCHQLIDPIGFAFESYDGVGRYRTEEDGRTIDVSGALIGTDNDGTFLGVPELAERLSHSEEARACAARQWFRYVMERFEQDADGCTMAGLMSDFAASDYRFASLRGSLVKSAAFRFRRPIQEQEP